MRKVIVLPNQLITHNNNNFGLKNEKVNYGFAPPKLIHHSNKKIKSQY